MLGDKALDGVAGDVSGEADDLGKVVVQNREGIDQTDELVVCVPDGAAGVTLRTQNQSVPQQCKSTIESQCPTLSNTIIRPWLRKGPETLFQKNALIKT